MNKLHTVLYKVTCHTSAFVFPPTLTHTSPPPFPAKWDWACLAFRATCNNDPRTIPRNSRAPLWNRIAEKQSSLLHKNKSILKTKAHTIEGFCWLLFLWKPVYLWKRPKDCMGWNRRHQESTNVVALKNVELLDWELIEKDFELLENLSPVWPLCSRTQDFVNRGLQKPSIINFSSNKKQPSEPWVVTIQVKKNTVLINVNTETKQ